MLLLRVGGARSILGGAAPFAMQLAAATSAVSQTNDYKALVCIFLFGGNDSHNMLLATDADSWGRYFTARNTGADPIALMPVGTAATPVGQTNSVTGRTAGQYTPESWGGVLPITAYGTSKAAVIGLTRQLAVQFAKHRVRVNAVCPGPIETPILDPFFVDPEVRRRFSARIPIGRMGVPDDVVQLSVYLASDESSFMTGSILTIDGGITAT